jgi:VWFA-related protein
VLKEQAMVHPWWRAVLVSAILPFMLQTQVDLQAQSDAQNPVFRLQVRRVPVDIVVLDKKGNPVHGLKKDDFVVKEDGKTQHILSFDTFDGTKPSFIPPKLPALPTNTFMDVPTVPERGPLYILYYDMVNTPRTDQMAFRRELLKFIDEAQPGVRIALFVNAKGLHLMQGFTSDHPLLRQAVLQKGPAPHLPDVFIYGENYGASDVGACLSNLNFISEYLSGIPGRKNLIWLASNFPIPVSPTMTGRSTQTAGVGPQLYSVGAQGGPQVLDLTELERKSIQRAYSAMMRSQIALYPVNVSGVAGASEFGQASNAIVDDQNTDMIASATGGKAYYSNNRMSELIEKAVEHGESYYTLSYDSSNSKYDGSERHIQVSLAKKNEYTLTYRMVYYAVSDDDVQEQHKKDELQTRFLAAKARDTLYADVEHGAPMLHDLLFSAHLEVDGQPQMATPEQMQALEDSPAYFRTRKRNKPQKPLTPVKLQRYVIDYGVVDPQLKAIAAHQPKPVALEFAAAAYDPDGRLLNSMLNQGVPSGNKGKSDALFHAIQELEVPPGAAYIRLVVRNTMTNRTGTLEVKLPLKPEAPQQAMGGTGEPGKQ